jgi:hypothetical protein
MMPRVGLIDLDDRGLFRAVEIVREVVSADLDLGPEGAPNLARREARN